MIFITFIFRLIFFLLPKVFLLLSLFPFQPFSIYSIFTWPMPFVLWFSIPNYQLILFVFFVDVKNKLIYIDRMIETDCIVFAVCFFFHLISAMNNYQFVGAIFLRAVVFSVHFFIFHCKIFTFSRSLSRRFAIINFLMRTVGVNFIFGGARHTFLAVHHWNDGDTTPFIFINDCINACHLSALL